MVKIIDKFEKSILTLEQALKDIEEKKSVEIEQKGVEENFINIYRKTYNFMQKYIHAPQQRKEAEEILKKIQKKYNKIQIIKDDKKYPKRQIYKKPLRLDCLFEIMGKSLKINYK